MDADQLKKEVEELRKECEHLRSERDAVRSQWKNAEQNLEDESALRLKLLSESLSRDVRERFMNYFRNALWIITLLIAIATAGGVWKISDLVSDTVGDQVSKQIETKEKDVAHIRKQIIDAVVEFREEASKSLQEIDSLKSKVMQESERASGEIKKFTRQFISEQTTVVVQANTTKNKDKKTNLELAWEKLKGVAPEDTVIVSSTKDLSYDDPLNQSGAFSFRFNKALISSHVDINTDKLISIPEVINNVTKSLEVDGFKQTPLIIGDAEPIALFRTLPLRYPDKKDKAGNSKFLYKNIHALLIGINRYGEYSDLKFAINDVNEFRKNLNTQKTKNYESISITTLLDDQATYERVLERLKKLVQSSEPDDLVLLFFSGHQSVFPKGPPSKSYFQNAILPSDSMEDGNVLLDKLIYIEDLIENLKQSKAKHKLIIIDG